MTVTSLFFSCLRVKLSNFSAQDWCHAICNKEPPIYFFYEPLYITYMLALKCAGSYLGAEEHDFTT